MVELLNMKEFLPMDLIQFNIKHIDIDNKNIIVEATLTTEYPDASGVYKTTRDVMYVLRHIPNNVEELYKDIARHCLFEMRYEYKQREVEKAKDKIFEDVLNQLIIGKEYTASEHDVFNDQEKTLPMENLHIKTIVMQVLLDIGLIK